MRANACTWFCKRGTACCGSRSCSNRETFKKILRSRHSLSKICSFVGIGTTCNSLLFVCLRAKAYKATYGATRRQRCAANGFRCFTEMVLAQRICATWDILCLVGGACCKLTICFLKIHAGNVEWRNVRRATLMELRTAIEEVRNVQLNI